MTQVLVILLLNSLYINGLRLAFEEGMIFEKFSEWGEEYFGKLWMPIAGCVTCMASVHSWPYLIGFINWNNWHRGIVEACLYICALAAVNTIIYKKFIDDSDY
jgi:hypothetical protein